METTYTWRSTEYSHTILTLRNWGIPKGFSKFMAPFMINMMKKANIKD